MGELFSEYSLRDITLSLFVIFSWRRNISSILKQFISYRVVLNLKDFNSINRIGSYQEFTDFFIRFKELYPSLSQFEDYIPVPDCGEVKYFFKDKFYKIFFSSSVNENYTYLLKFDLVFFPYSKKILELENRDIEEEYISILEYNNYIIEIISQYNSELDDKVCSGHFEIPSEQYFNNIYRNYDNIGSKYNNKIINNASINLTDNTSLLTFDEIINDFFENSKQYLFIKRDTEYFPIFCRDYIVALTNDFYNILEKHKKEYLPQNRQAILDISLSFYIKERFHPRSFFEMPYTLDSQAEKFIQGFACGFYSGDYFYLIYNLDFLSSFEEELTKLKVIMDEMKIQLKLKKYYLQFNTDDKKAFRIDVDSDKIKILTVLPFIDTKDRYFMCPSDLNNIEVLTLNDFINIFDEKNCLDDLDDFFQFKRQNTFMSETDTNIFYSFIKSSKTIFQGATQPDLISFGVNDSEYYKYDSLKEFWRIYPKQNPYGKPHSWRLVEMEYIDSVRMESKINDEIIYYKKIGLAHLFISSQMDRKLCVELVSFNFEVLIECLIFNLNKYKNVLNDFDFFNDVNIEKIYVKIVPQKLAESSSNYYHLRHLLPKEEDDFKIDYGKINAAASSFGIRIVYNDARLYDLFIENKNRKLENDLFISILSSIPKIKNDKNFKNLEKIITATNDDKTGFGLNRAVVKYLPGLIQKVYVPETEDFKKARNIIAKICKENNINPAVYSNSDGYQIINSIIRHLVNYLKNKFNELNYEETIKFLITQIDLTMHEYEKEISRLNKSHEYYIAYDAVARRSEVEEERLKQVKNIRYFIELIAATHIDKENVTLTTPSIEKYKLYLAIIDWVYVISQINDNLYYMTEMNCKLVITDDYLVNDHYDEEFSSKYADFGKYLSNRKLSRKKGFNFGDVIDYTSYIKGLSDLFYDEIGFSLYDLYIVLDILAHWNPSGQNNVEEFYNLELYFDLVDGIINEFEAKPDKDVVKNILDFLTLKDDLIMTTIDNDDNTRITHDIIPIWEHYKRDYRYALKPILKIQDKMIWGRMSAFKTSNVWNMNLQSFTLPFDLNIERIKQFQSSYQKKIEDYIVDYTENIIKKKYQITFKEKEIYKLDKKGNHPRDLGDYDVIGINFENNKIVYIECKYISPSYCMKDAKRDMEKIFFGKERKGKEYLKKAENRYIYLSDNLNTIIENLNWKFKDNSEVVIDPIFLLLKHNYWTKNPIKETEVKFMDLDELEEFLEK